MQRVLWGELPLRGAARLEKGRSCFLGSSRCAGLLDWRNAEAALGGAPAARGCSIGVRERLLLGELSLMRGAAGLRTGGSCFGGSSRCAGLLDWSTEWLLWGEPQLRGAAGPDICVYVTCNYAVSRKISHKSAMKRSKSGQSGACGGLNAGTWPLRGPGFPSGRQGLALTDHQTQLPNIPGQRSHSEKATLIYRLQYSTRTVL